MNQSGTIATGKPGVRWTATRNAALAALIGGIGLAAPHAAAQTTLLITDFGGNKVVRFDYPSGQAFDHFVGSGISPLDGSTGMTLTPDGDLLVGSYYNNGVQLYSGQTGRFIRSFVPAGGPSLWGSYMMAYGPNGNLYVASTRNDLVVKYNGTTGVFMGDVVTGIDATDIVFGPDGTMYVADFAGDRVAMFDPTDGTFLGNVDTSSTGLDGPHGLAQDASDNIYVTSYNTDSIIKIDINTLEDSFFVFPGAGSLDGPTDLAFDDAGNAIVVSALNGNVLKYDQFGNFNSVVISPATDGGLSGTWGLLLYTPGDPCAADFNDDGTVNTQDFISFLNAWTAGCS